MYIHLKYPFRNLAVETLLFGYLIVAKLNYDQCIEDFDLMMTTVVEGKTDKSISFMFHCGAS